MTLSASTVFEVRTTGSDTNGGGFVTGSSGTDYSQQNSAQYALSNGVTNGTTTVATTSASTDMVGNIAYIAGGTGSITGAWYQIVSVSAGVSIVVDNSTGLTTGTGVTINVGGALATPATAISLMTLSGIQTYIQAGTYSHAAITWPSFTNGTAFTRLIGYNTTRNDLGVGGRPVMQSTGSGFLLTLGNSNTGQTLENIDFNGNSVSGSDGVSSGQLTLVSNCIFRGFAHFRAYLAAAFGTVFVNNEVKSNTATAAAVSMGSLSGYYAYNYIHDNSSDGFNGGGSSSVVTLLGNIVYNNTGNGITVGITAGAPNSLNIIGNDIHNNNGDGIHISATSLNLTSPSIANNIITSNGGYGVNVLNAPSPSLAYMGYFNNAYYNNFSGARNNISAESGAVTLTGVPYVAAGSGNFALNSTAGQGAACKAVGFPGVLNAGGTGYRDLGPLQSQAGAGGGLLINPGITGGCGA